MTVTTKQIETIKFQLEFMVMMQDCGRVNEANGSLQKITTLMNQLFGVDVVWMLRRDLFEALKSINEGHRYELERLEA
jgi:hypothetical protein